MMLVSKSFVHINFKVTGSHYFQSRWLHYFPSHWFTLLSMSLAHHDVSFKVTTHDRDVSSQMTRSRFFQSQWFTLLVKSQAIPRPRWWIQVCPKCILGIRFKAGLHFWAATSLCDKKGEGAQPWQAKLSMSISKNNSTSRLNLFWPPPLFWTFSPLKMGHT